MPSGRTARMKRRYNTARMSLARDNMCREGGNPLGKNTITRRDFAATTAGALAIMGELAAQTAGQKNPPPLDLAEWSYFWIGVERAELARGPVGNGREKYVE